MNSKIAEELDVNLQWKLLSPLESILYETGIKLSVDQEGIFAAKGAISKKLIIYPAMKNQRSTTGEIVVSDYMLKYAKPTAMEYIVNGF